jgi:hypothetical protein
MRSYLGKTTSQKWAGRIAQGVGPEFKPQYCKSKDLPMKGHHIYNGTVKTHCPVV